MATKSKPTGEAKKPGRSVKEKRAAKQQKQATQKQVRKGWEAKWLPFPGCAPGPGSNRRALVAVIDDGQPCARTTWLGDREPAERWPRLRAHRKSVDEHPAHIVGVTEVLVPLVDPFERVGPGHHPVKVELSLTVELAQLRNVVSHIG